MLPATLRSTVRKSSGEKNIVCLVKHDRWKCIAGFGLSHIDQREEAIRHAAATVPGYDLELHLAQLSILSEVPFDDSGRFVLPNQLISSANIGEELFFHGLTDSFLIWNPDELARMGEGWEGIKAACEDERARAKKGGKE